MKKMYSLPTRVLLLSKRAGLLPLLAGALALGGCQSETEAVPDQGPEYYPLAVGAYRIYDVVDTSYQANVPTVSRFQFKEQVESAVEPDVTGQPAYRIVRSRRALATDAWRVDSVITVTTTGRALTEQRHNRRTVELVFPVQEGKSWNWNAFNALDTVVAVNRFYTRVGQPFSISRGGKTYQYENTLTTTSDVSEAAINAAYYTVIRSTFAPGVGPVYRVRRRFISRCDAVGCNPVFRQQGQSRSEVLIETGQ